MWERLEIQKVSIVSLTPMGGNLALISVQEGASFEEVLRDNEKEFSRWFTEISPWNSKSVATARSIWVKILGVPAHIWDEKFFRQISQLVGAYISIDDSTREKVRLDTIRVLITTSVKEIINTVIEVKVNGTVYNIRMLEESFGDNMSRFISNWKYQNSEGNSSDEDDSMANSVLRVPETELFAGIGEDDVGRLNREFSNSFFGKIPTPEEKRSNRGKYGSVEDGAHGGRDVQLALNAQKDVTLQKSRDDHVSNTKLVIQKAGRILESPTNLLDESGRRVKFVDVSELGLGEKYIVNNQSVGMVVGASAQLVEDVDKHGGLCNECLTYQRHADQKAIGLDEINISYDGLVGGKNISHRITLRDPEQFTTDDIEDLGMGLFYNKHTLSGEANVDLVGRKGRSRKKLCKQGSGRRRFWQPRKIRSLFESI